MSTVIQAGHVSAVHFPHCFFDTPCPMHFAGEPNARPSMSPPTNGGGCQWPHLRWMCVKARDSPERADEIDSALVTSSPQAVVSSNQADLHRLIEIGLSGGHFR